MFPEFFGEDSIKEIEFSVYNTGKTTAVNCQSFMEITNLENSKNEGGKQIHWPWKKYEAILYDNAQIRYLQESQLIYANISPGQKLTLNRLTSSYLDERNDEDFESFLGKYLIKISVYAENVIEPAVYFLELNSTENGILIDKDVIKNAEREKEHIEDVVRTKSISNLTYSRRNYSEKK